MKKRIMVINTLRQALRSFEIKDSVEEVLEQKGSKQKGSKQRGSKQKVLSKRVQSKWFQSKGD